MQEMTRRFGNPGIGGFPLEQTLVLNSKNNLIARLAELKNREDRKEETEMICRHVYDLAMLNHKPLEPGDMAEFVKRSNKLLTRLAELES